jgi:hypothetical protein
MEWTVECRMTTELGTQDVQEGNYPKKKRKSVLLVRLAVCRSQV